MENGECWAQRVLTAGGKERRRPPGRTWWRHFTDEGGHATGSLDILRRHLIDLQNRVGRCAKGCRVRVVVADCVPYIVCPIPKTTTSMYIILRSISYQVSQICIDIFMKLCSTHSCTISYLSFFFNFLFDTALNLIFSLRRLEIIGDWLRRSEPFVQLLLWSHNSWSHVLRSMCVRHPILMLCIISHHQQQAYIAAHKKAQINTEREREI